MALKQLPVRGLDAWKSLAERNWPRIKFRTKVGSIKTFAYTGKTCVGHYNPDTEAGWVFQSFRGAGDE